MLKYSRQFILLHLLVTLTYWSCQKEQEDATAWTSCDYPNRLSKYLSYYYYKDGTINTTEHLIVYDAENKLVIQKSRALGIATYHDTQFLIYDKFGNCIRKVVLDSWGYQAQEYLYEYNKDRLIKTYETLSNACKNNRRMLHHFVYEENRLEAIKTAYLGQDKASTLGRLIYLEDRNVIYAMEDQQGRSFAQTRYRFTNLKNPKGDLSLQCGFIDHQLLVDSTWQDQLLMEDLLYKYKLDRKGRVAERMAYVEALGSEKVVERYFYDCVD